ncbi:unnamed protein product [Allacma fusca]|uniref:Peptidase S8/S53 domain-containing protein n=1 Tax=Allacma fusca TaxID=39272 RepID=A0A8J2JPH4_9HEXA|nr:unnamed protein product [Allacma fusca]
MKLFTSLVFLGLACAALSAPILDSSLLRTLQEKGTADILISFKNADVKNVRTRAVSQARALGGSLTAVRQSMFDALTAHADETQASALKMINKHRSSVKRVIPLWITNQISVKGATLKLVEDLALLGDISEVRIPSEGGLIEPVTYREVPESSVQAGEQWGILAIDAPAAWAQGINGSGVVIGSLDTGARISHVALRSHYRADHGWFDPIEDYLTATDYQGHGTHTIGTMLGSVNGIGVAPGAKFISCKGMDRYGDATEADFIACGQFFVCPHLPTDPRDDPRCDLAPVAVGNSWGYVGNDGFYDAVIDAWIDAGIAPVFAAGNEGTSCYTIRSPGTTAQSITVGATNNQNQMTDFSSVGPSHQNLTKPTISAPGQDIISCYINADSDTSYSSQSGTSMATPHVVGLIALLHHKKPNLTVAQVQAALIAGAQPTTPTGKTCGGIADSTYPNNHVGYGQISVPASLAAL